MNALLKALVAATWMVALACLVLPGDSAILRAGQLLFWVLAGVHLVECLVFLPTLRRTGRPLAGELAQVMLFGVIHYGEVQQHLREQEALGGGPPAAG